MLTTVMILTRAEISASSFHRHQTLVTEGKNQALVGAIPFCGEYPGPRFEDKFRSANEMDRISIADRGKMADS